MNLALSPLFEASPARALLVREFRAALINRYFQVFCGLALIGGATAVVFSEDPNAVGFFLLQIALYFVSLFALLTGVSSAQGEQRRCSCAFTSRRCFWPRPLWLAGWPPGSSRTIARRR